MTIERQLMAAFKSSGGYQIPNSLRFRSSASAYLNRTFGTPTNGKLFTYGFWFKASLLQADQYFFEGYVDDVNRPKIGFGSNSLIFSIYQSNTTIANLTTTQVFRDPSAWYHCVIAYDSTQATASDRVKMYVNGVQITAFSTATYPPQNQTTYLNAANVVNIGRSGYAGGSASSTYFDGYMAEVNFIDGQALTPSSFGAFSSATGVWGPKAYSGTYGTNGFYLKFNNGTSTTTLGYDSSGNSNNWTTNNISLTAGSTYDWMLDSPTPYAGSSYGVGNYAVLNPLNKELSSLSAANLTATGTTSSFGAAYATIYVSSGKWYWEGVFTTVDPNDGSGFGISGGGQICDIRNQTGSSFLVSNVTGVPGQNPFGVGYSSNDIIGVAFDVDNLTLSFYKNGTLIGSTVTGFPAGRSWVFYIVCRASSSTTVGAVNFGQRPFAFSPPSGYKSLCTQNLPTPTIQQGNKFMDAVLRNGFGTSGGTVSSLNFQPDFVLGKPRNNVGNNTLVDSVRGVSKYLVTDATSAEGTDVNYMLSFNSNGFTQGTNDWPASYTIVDWCWKASNASAVSNTAGSITSQVSANTTAGFSVVTYTGTGANATVGHGLGVAPAMIIVKNRSRAQAWDVYHQSLGNGGGVFLNTTGAYYATSVMWNNTSPTSTVFSLGSGDDVNYSGSSLVAYCFAAIPGYSAFGSYTGNGSTDGPFVYLGFRPRYVMVKNTSSIGSWVIHDTARNTYNVVDNTLLANTADSEYSANSPIDILSNGFKLRSASVNDSGNTFVYAAFAENPFSVALAR